MLERIVDIEADVVHGGQRRIGEVSRCAGLLCCGGGDDRVAIAVQEQDDVLSLTGR